MMYLWALPWLAMLVHAVWLARRDRRRVERFIASRPIANRYFDPDRRIDGRVW